MITETCHKRTPKRHSWEKEQKKHRLQISSSYAYTWFFHANSISHVPFARPISSQYLLHIPSLHSTYPHLNSPRSFPPSVRTSSTYLSKAPKFLSATAKRRYSLSRSRTSPIFRSPGPWTSKNRLLGGGIFGTVTCLGGSEAAISGKAWCC